MTPRTPSLRCNDVAEAWNPWRSLRERDHIEFALRSLPDVTGGAVCWPQVGWTAILIDKRLPRRDRNAALAHELVHDEQGGACPTAGMPAQYQAVAHRHENRVRREVARRLVPLEDLREVIASIEANELPWGLVEISEIFDVPEHVAAEAVKMVCE